MSLAGDCETVPMRRRNLQSKFHRSYIGYYTFIMQSSVHEDALTDLSVAKRKETTRSHPEHGRKDFHRRQYSEGSLPGR